MSTVIKVENLSKSYRLGSISTGSLHKDLQSFWARLRGKEDPNRRIGESSQQRANDDLFWALNDVSFEVKQGEVLGILGRNGAGKSTLLKILSRITAPTQGSVKIRGRIASLLEVGTGFHPELTGRENVYLNGAILGMTRREIASKFDEIVSFAETEQFIDTPVKRYSSGMYVRLAFAVAAYLDSEILIVDEVLAVGDAEFQKKCLGIMGEVSKKEGRTVFFVSHNMGAQQKLCSQCMLLRYGALELIGPPSVVIGQYVASANQAGAVCQKIPRESIVINTGELEIVKVSMQGASGQITNSFLLNEKITCIIEFDVAKNVENIVFDLQIGTPVEKIAYYMSQDSLSPIKMPVGRHTISVDLENNFLPDTYYLSLAAHQLGNIRTLVLAEQFMQLEVLNASIDHAPTYPYSVKFGHIKQTSRWHVKP